MDTSLSTQQAAGGVLVGELGAAGFVDAEEIGRGGCGVVFCCRQAVLDRIVAVKVLTAELREDRQRFLREQRAMGRLTGHPNIVGVLQVGETASGYPYLVMQYHRQGPLQRRIARLGRLSLGEVLQVGIKIAGALEAAHGADVVHRDVKPGNILVTDFGQPALSDFGIAHIAGGFETETGTFAGSPSFTAPETLSGDAPSPASDVYGLGATLFAALTGHAPYERKSGEQIVAQFLRITTDPLPDLRAGDVPDDVAVVIEQAMAGDPAKRPSAAALGVELARVQARHGLAGGAGGLGGEQPAGAGVAWTPRRYVGNLPGELSSFVGRHTELGEVNALLAASRLVTLVGIGGVGKTRLALRAATELRAEVDEGVWWVELGEVSDPALVVNAVVGALGLSDRAGRSPRELLIAALGSRPVVLVLDTCEHVLDEVVNLVDAVLRACPEVKILATSRERLGLGAEAVVLLGPLGLPEADEPTLGGLAGSDAVALFSERAAEAVAEFALSEDNEATVAQICSRLDGLPLAIELAAARLRAMTVQQILQRLDDRFGLLTLGSRAAPTRQRTLAHCVDWSYQLCTSAEQRLWARLSVFAGSFDLEAAEDIGNDDLAPDNVVDLVTSLVDKSILFRTEAHGQVRLRLLDTLRDYGRHKLSQAGEYLQLRSRHLHWYQQLMAQAAIDWFGPRQLAWSKRLEVETPNWREALDFALTDAPQTALAMAPGLGFYSFARGLFGETGQWLDRLLTATPAEPSAERMLALYAAAVMAMCQPNLPLLARWANEARCLVEQVDNPWLRGWAALIEGYYLSFSGDFDGALTRSDEALAAVTYPIVQVTAMVTKAVALEGRGEFESALGWLHKALAITQSVDEMVFQSLILWFLGIGYWRTGDHQRAHHYLRQCLQLSRLVDDPRNGAAALEATAWVLATKNDPQRATVLMAAADAVATRVGSSPTVFPDLIAFHDQCMRHAREALEPDAFHTAWQRGASMDFDTATAYALDQDDLDAIG